MHTGLPSLELLVPAIVADTSLAYFAGLARKSLPNHQATGSTD
jgi:hypothetical protein